MKTQLTLVAALLTLTLSGCQVESLAVDGNAASTPDSNESITPVASSNPSTKSPEGVMLYWSAPNQRVNGSSVSVNDIQGYEIRYKNQSTDDYTTILIRDGSTNQLSLDDIDNANEYQFEVAAIDKYGIYSKYVTASQI